MFLKYKEFQLRSIFRIALLLCLFAFAGCANIYIDGSTPEVSKSEFKKPDVLKPVQVIFEFQTKGVANGRATKALQQQVVNQIQDSQIFSVASTEPAAGGAILSIKINNVPLSDNAFSKGFLTGMTFGLKGSQVSDGYVCTATYIKAGSNAEIVKTARHAIHTTIGAAAAPGNATKASGIEDAIRTMTRQVLSTTLDALSKDPSFN